MGGLKIMHIQGGIKVRGQCSNKRTKTGDFNRLLPYGGGACGKRLFHP